MSRVPGKGYFRSLSTSTGFKSDVLEKVWRLLEILGRSEWDGCLRGKLALKGGTAIQGQLFGFHRLSVDIDLNYVGNIDRNSMLSDRDIIRDDLMVMFSDLGYRVNVDDRTYAEERFDLHFINSGGGSDHVKLEINYLERMPMAGVHQGIINHPFPDLPSITVNSLGPEELVAGKLRAMVTRASPRDLFDTALISQGRNAFDISMLRPLFLLHMAMADTDARDLNLDKGRSITIREIDNVLMPVLPRTMKPDLDEMLKAAETLLHPLFVLNDSEARFFDLFYSEGVIEAELLLKGAPLRADLTANPALQWRLRRLGGQSHDH